jgi:hypothetical protein
MVNGTLYVNLTDHQLDIKSGDEVYHFGPNPNPKPKLVADNILVDNNDIDEHLHVYRDVVNLPAKKDGVIYIVPLFTLDAVERMSRDKNCPNNLKGRNDLRAPGKKVFGEGGKLLYAEGLKRGTVVHRI